MASVGYTSKQIFDTDTKTSVLALIDRRLASRTGDGFLPARGAADLFGRRGWGAMMWARHFGRNWKILTGSHAVAFGAACASAYLYPGLVTISATVLLLILPLLSLFLCLKGLASLDGFVDGLEQLLVKKVGASPSGGRLTFGDLKAAGSLPLKIVASDISVRGAHVFSADRTSSTSVAEAVAASVCLPVIFKPRRIGPQTFYDGGLVSNLPVWTFDEERGLDRDAATVTIEIADTEPVAEISNLGGLSGLSAAIRTGLFGAQTLNKRAVANLYSIGLKPHVGLLDFDMTPTTAAEEIERARSDCELRLVYRLVSLHAHMRALSRTIAEGALGMINASRIAAQLPALTDAPRVAMVLPAMGTKQTLQLAHGWGYDDASDAGLLLPIEGSFLKNAWQLGRSTCVEASDPAWARYLSRPEDRSIRRMLWRDKCWLVTIPYKRDGNVVLVTMMDGALPLSLTQPQKKALLDSLTGSIAPILDGAVPEELFHDGY